MLLTRKLVFSCMLCAAVYVCVDCSVCLCRGQRRQPFALFQSLFGQFLIQSLILSFSLSFSFSYHSVSFRTAAHPRGAKATCVDRPDRVSSLLHLLHIQHLQLSSSPTLSCCSQPRAVCVCCGVATSFIVHQLSRRALNLRGSCLVSTNSICWLLQHQASTVHSAQITWGGRWRLCFSMCTKALHLGLCGSALCLNFILSPSIWCCAIRSLFLSACHVPPVSRAHLIPHTHPNLSFSAIHPAHLFRRAHEQP